MSPKTWEQRRQKRIAQILGKKPLPLPVPVPVSIPEKTKGQPPMGRPKSTGKCRECKEDLPEGSSLKTICDECKEYSQYVPLTTQQKLTKPGTPRPGLCQHCIDDEPFMIFTFVKAIGKSFWLCWTCRVYSLKTGALPLLKDDFNSDSEGNTPI